MQPLVPHIHSTLRKFWKEVALFYVQESTYENQSYDSNCHKLVNYYRSKVYFMTEQVNYLQDKILELKTHKRLLNEQHQSKVNEL